MNIINVEMLDITDKQLICTSGNFVMGVKGDNETTKVVFNVPDKFKQTNAFVILVTPDKSHQYNVPLQDMSFIVTSSISNIVGAWNLILMLTGNETETSMPICVSDAVVGTIKDSDIDTTRFETLPVDANLQILYNNMLTLYNELQDSLVGVEIETVVEIQEDLETILNGMSQILAIDWNSLASLGNMGQDLQEIKTLTTTMNNNIVLSTNSINSMETKIDDIKIDVEDLDLVLDNIDIKTTTISGDTSSLKTNIASIKNDILLLVTQVSSILSGVDSINLKSDVVLEKIGTSQFSMTLFQVLENVYGMTQNLYQMVGEGVVSKLYAIKLDTANIVDIKTDTTTIKEDVVTLKSDTATLKNDTTSILSILGTINDELAGL